MHELPDIVPVCLFEFIFVFADTHVLPVAPGKREKTLRINHFELDILKHT